MHDDIDATQKLDVIVVLLREVFDCRFKSRGAKGDEVVLRWDVLLEELLQLIIFLRVDGKVIVEAVVELRRGIRVKFRFSLGECRSGERKRQRRDKAR